MVHKTPNETIQVIFDPEPIRLKSKMGVCPKCERVYPERPATCEADGEVLVYRIPSMGQFARACGIHPNAYSGLIQNARQLRIKTIAGMIAATGCRVQDLFKVIKLSS